MQDLLEQIAKLHRVLQELDNSVWYDKDLCGACAFSAYLTYKIAKKLNYTSQICMTHDFKYGSHCWCIVEGKVIDATATQFRELRSFLDENELLIADTIEIYKSLFKGEQYHIDIVHNDTEFVSLTSNWSYQSVPNCLQKYGEIISQKLDIELSI